MRVLIDEEPARFSMTQLRTMQRRLRDWRAARAGESGVLPATARARKEAGLGFSSGDGLAVTIGGEPFPHLLVSQRPRLSSARARGMASIGDSPTYARISESRVLRQWLHGQGPVSATCSRAIMVGSRPDTWLEACAKAPQGQDRIQGSALTDQICLERFVPSSGQDLDRSSDRITVSSSRGADSANRAESLA